MTQVIIKDNQITLPNAILAQANLSENDVVEISCQTGGIFLQLAKKSPRTSLMDYAGIVRGLYGDSVEEVQDYIDDIRDDRELDWDK